MFKLSDKWITFFMFNKFKFFLALKCGKKGQYKLLKKKNEFMVQVFISLQKREFITNVLKIVL